jgi:hypothetical protein
MQKRAMRTCAQATECLWRARPKADIPMALSKLHPVEQEETSPRVFRRVGDRETAESSPLLREITMSHTIRSAVFQGSSV